MSKIIYVELLNSEQVNVYHNRKKHTLADSELGDYRQFQWVLLDSLYIVSKIFSQPVKNKKLLNQVIPAHFESFLSEGIGAYSFAHQEFNGTRWVSWIDNQRLSEIKARFKRYQNQIIGLTATPLLFLSANQGERILRIDSAPYSHFLFSDETLSLQQEHASLWLKSANIEATDKVNLDDAQILASLDFALINQLPNLWQKKSKSVSTSSSGLNKVLGGLLFILVCLWSVNHWLAYNNAEKALAAVKAEQQALLKQALPNADTPDVYGRLKAEQANNSDEFAVLAKLNQALANAENYKIESLSIDLENKSAELTPTLPNSDALSAQGFNVSTDNNTTELTWGGQ